MSLSLESPVYEATYFISKCINLDGLDQCIKTCVWACRDHSNSPHPREILSSAHHKGPVILIFSVNNQHGWHGYCESLFNESPRTSSSYPTSNGTPPQEVGFISSQGISKFGGNDNADSAQPTLCNKAEYFFRDKNSWHHFNVRWLKHFLTFNKQACLKFEHTQHLLLPDGTPVNNSRNWQLVEERVGRELCELIDEHHQKLSIYKQLKEEEKLGRNEESFFKEEAATLGTEVCGGWTAVIRKVERDLGKVHLACPFGSQRYNCSLPESDNDVFIVYQAKTTQVLSLDPPRQTIKNSERELVDYTVLELQRYCELLLAGDQRCIETLFLEETKAVALSTCQWRQLCKLRHHLLNRSCFDKYMKEAQGNTGLKQLQKWKDNNPVVDQLTPKLNKLSYISIRLLQNARDLVALKTLKVYRDEDSVQRKELLDVRQGKYSYSELMGLVESYLREIEKSEANLSDVDMAVAKRKVENWLLMCRIQDLDINPYQPADQNL
ncbi:unnamed protein product [Lymnaea stagnalis]|uniref:YTH domain-containing protein n=1 Tax=Lymnaea stagnalis TaxID=6523 RepID=A0AAV2I9L4_LYMST